MFLHFQRTESTRDLFITTNPPTDNPMGSPRRCIRNCNSLNGRNKYYSLLFVPLNMFCQYLCIYRTHQPRQNVYPAIFIDPPVHYLLFLSPNILQMLSFFHISSPVHMIVYAQTFTMQRRPPIFEYVSIRSSLRVQIITIRSSN